MQGVVVVIVTFYRQFPALKRGVVIIIEDCLGLNSVFFYCFLSLLFLLFLLKRVCCFSPKRGGVFNGKCTEVVIAPKFTCTFGLHA